MVTLFDIMRNAQRGEGFANLSRQFGLSQADTQRAVEALLPAFTLGFQRNVHNPNAFGQLVDLLSSGQYAPFFDQAKPNASAAAWVRGNEVLTQILGSKEVSRQVAEQAASMTGIGAKVLEQMLPMMAATIMGGVFRYASLEGLGDLLAQWSDAFHKAHDAQRPPAARPPPAQSAVANPFEAWMGMVGSMFGAPSVKSSQSGFLPRPEQAPRGDSSPTEIWSNIVDAMLGKTPKKQEPPAPPKPPPAENPLQMLSQMFETGREVQAQHLATLQSILDGFWSAGRVR